MADSFNFTKNSIIHLMEVKKVINREYNGIKWDIYYSNHSNIN